MLQFTTVVASGWPFLQWFPPSAPKLIVVNVAGGPPAFADAAGSIASAKSNVVMKTPSFFIPTTPKPPALVRRRRRNAAAEVRPFLAGEPYGAVSHQGITRTLYASRRGMRLCRIPAMTKVVGRVGCRWGTGRKWLDRLEYSMWWSPKPPAIPNWQRIRALNTGFQVSRAVVRLLDCESVGLGHLAH